MLMHVQMRGARRAARFGPCRGRWLRAEYSRKGTRLLGVTLVAQGTLVVDIRAFDPALRRSLVFAVIDKLVETDAQDQLMLVSDHDPSGLGYQIDLRRESRGMFEFSCQTRSDGAWVAFIRRKRTR